MTGSGHRQKGEAILDKGKIVEAGLLGTVETCWETISPGINVDDTTYLIIVADKVQPFLTGMVDLWMLSTLQGIHMIMQLVKAQAGVYACVLHKKRIVGSCSLVISFDNRKKILIPCGLK